MERQPRRRSGSNRGAQVGDAMARARMVAFAVVFVIAVVVGLIAGAGVSALAIASIAGGLASIGVERSWHLWGRRRQQ